MTFSSLGIRRLLLCACLCALGCTRGRSEVLLGMLTDLPAPTTLDRVQLIVQQQGVQIVQQDWDLSGLPSQPFNLPGSFGIISEKAICITLALYN